MSLPKFTPPFSEAKRFSGRGVKIFAQVSPMIPTVQLRVAFFVLYPLWKRDILVLGLGPEKRNGAKGDFFPFASDPQIAYNDLPTEWLKRGTIPPLAVS